MKVQAKQTLEKLVDRFNLSIQTHHHAILLLNLLYIKGTQFLQKDQIRIPKKSNWSDYSNSDVQQDENKQGNLQQYQVVLKQQIPLKQVVQVLICTFLSHKLYQSYPICLVYMLRFLNIEDKFQQYIISLENEMVKILKWKIQNLIPFSETLYVCQKWDGFAEELSINSVDVRFGINRLFREQKLQIKTCHKIQQHQKQKNNLNLPNSTQNMEYQHNYNCLRKNLQNIVYSHLIYQHVAKNQHSKTQIPTMRKIALALMYNTISKLSKSSLFCKNIRSKQKHAKSINAKKYSSLKKRDNKYFKTNLKVYDKNLANHQKYFSNNSSLNFIFNDFLKNQFQIDLRDLINQIFLTKQIIFNSLHKNHFSKQNQVSMEQIDKNIQAKKNYLIEDKNKIKSNRKFYQNQHHLYHKKCSRTISSTKTQDQNKIKNNQKNFQRCHSNLSIKKQRKKQNESTMGKSNESEIDITSVRKSQEQSLSSHSDEICIGKKQNSLINEGNNRKHINMITAFYIEQ